MVKLGSRKPVGRFEGRGVGQEGFLEDELQAPVSERTHLLGGLPGVGWEPWCLRSSQQILPGIVTNTAGSPHLWDPASHALIQH